MALPPPQRPTGRASVVPGTSSRQSSGAKLPSGELDSAQLLQNWSANFEAGAGLPGQPKPQLGMSPQHSAQPLMGLSPQHSLQPLKGTSAQLAALNLQPFAAGYKAHAERGAHRIPLSEHDFSARGGHEGGAQPARPPPQQQQPRPWR